MFDDLLKDSFETLSDLPKEIGEQGIEQIKSSNGQQNQQQQQDDTQQHRSWIEQLYGKADPQMTPQQIEMKKKQDEKLKKQNYQKIQQDIQEFRAKKQQEVKKYEIGQQQGTEVARDQEEKMELWEKEQKKAEERKKEEEAARLPGSQQSRSGEQGVVMG
jgi:hypothetical protein